jgi:hypothetical protein
MDKEERQLQQSKIGIMLGGALILGIIGGAIIRQLGEVVILLKVIAGN